jgi:deoxyribose-phosphate aldolase
MHNPGIYFKPEWLHLPAQEIEDLNNRLNQIQPAEAKRETLLNIISCLDLTSLNATDTPEIIAALMKKAMKPVQNDPVQVGGVCIYQPFITQAKEALGDSGIHIATVAGGFPSGQMDLEVKCADVRKSVELGATEVDVVIRRTWPLTGNLEALYQEVVEMKKACASSARLKVIIASGELQDEAMIYASSMTCLMAGADMIKTSTGMEKVNATLNAGAVMLKAIRHFHQNTGILAGFKPAGGIRTTDQALQWWKLVEMELGEDFLNPRYFRIGASALLNDLTNKLQTA